MSDNGIKSRDEIVDERLSEIERQQAALSGAVMVLLGLALRALGSKRWRACLNEGKRRAWGVAIPDRWMENRRWFDLESVDDAVGCATVAVSDVCHIPIDADVMNHEGLP